MIPTQTRGKAMQARLTYVIKFVADMDKAVRFHRDKLGLKLRFQSPEWSEFQTGDVGLALHAASAKDPAGSVRLGYGVEDLTAVYAAREAEEITFLSQPKPLHGQMLAAFLDSEGAECSISGPG
jgi:catechol 2,3-dioxygenase-like lactoylglutathione lyase family enzyme